MSSLFDAAKEYQGLGWRVIPVKNIDNKKVPACEFKHLRELPADAEAFNALFQNGEYDGIAKIVNNEEIVIDIDGGEWPEMPVTPTLKTPRGYHYHFTRPVSLKLDKATLDFGDGMEVKAGGMLAGIHGMHPSGVSYEWVHNPKVTPFAELPGWITDKINKYASTQEKEGKKLSESDLEHILKGLSEGEGRNNGMMRLGGHFIGKGLAWAEIVIFLDDWNKKNKPPLSLSEFRTCKESLKKLYIKKEEAAESKTEAEEISTEDLNALVAKEQTLRLNLSLPEDHFISKYTKWMSSVSDAYYEYNVCGALWLLSASVEGNLCLKLRQETVYPNLWINCLGKSTTSRKTTAINKAKNTYETIADITLFNDDHSLEGYLESLAERPTQHYVRDEAAGLLAKMHKQYNEGIFEAECAIYDGQSYKKTLSSGKAKTPRVFEVKSPYVTHFYATTPDNYAMIMQLMDFLCGYGFRFLFCCPKYKKNTMDLELATQENIDCWAEVITTIKRTRHLIQNRQDQDFKATPEAMTLYNQMLRGLEEVCESQDNEILNAAIGRNQIHILKIAMLLEIGKAEPSFCITPESMKTAFHMVISFFLPSLFDVISRLQSDIKNNQVERVVAALRNMGGKAKKSKLLQNTHLKSREFAECIDTLIESEVVKAVQETGQKAITYILMDTNDISAILNKVSDFSSFSTFSTLAQSTENLAKYANLVSGDTNKDKKESKIISSHAGNSSHTFLCEHANVANVANVAKDGFENVSSISPDFFKRVVDSWEIAERASVNSSNLDKFVTYALMRHAQARITNVSKEDLEAFARHYFKLSSVNGSEIVIHSTTESARALAEELMREA